MKLPSADNIFFIVILGSGFAVLFGISWLWPPAHSQWSFGTVNLATIPPTWSLFIKRSDSAVATGRAAQPTQRAVDSPACPPRHELRSDATKLRQCLDAFDAEVSRIQLATERVEPQRITSQDGSQFWWSFELAGGQQVILSKYSDRQTANVKQFDVDGDGEYEVAHFSIDEEPSLSLVVYDVHKTSRGEFARFDDNQNRVLDPEEIFSYDASRGWWTGVGAGAPSRLALPWFLPNPIPFAFPFFYGLIFPILCGRAKQSSKAPRVSYCLVLGLTLPISVSAATSGDPCAPEILYYDDFGSADSPWQSFTGHWEEELGWLRQRSEEFSPPHSIRYLPSPSLDDGTFEVKVRIHTDRLQLMAEDDFSSARLLHYLMGAGILFRLQDPYNYYMFRIAGEEGAVLGKMVNHEWFDLCNPRTLDDFDPDAWYQLKVDAYDDRLTVYLNDQPLCSLRDDTYASGRIGLVTFKVQADFEYVKVYRPPASLEQCPLKTIFQDDFHPIDGRWQQSSGYWEARDGQLIQKADDPQSVNSIRYILTPAIADGIVETELSVRPGRRFQRLTAHDEQLARLARYIVGAGIVFRFKDSYNYYMFRLAGEEGAVLGKMVDGEWSDLCNPRLRHSLNGPRISFYDNAAYRLKADVYGDRISVFVNDQLICQVADDTHDVGGVGLVTFKIGATFNYIKVYRRF